MLSGGNSSFHAKALSVQRSQSNELHYALRVLAPWQTLCAWVRIWHCEANCPSMGPSPVPLWLADRLARVILSPQGARAVLHLGFSL